MLLTAPFGGHASEGGVVWAASGVGRFPLRVAPLADPIPLRPGLRASSGC
jgi:hypothetical protein